MSDAPVDRPRLEPEILAERRAPDCFEQDLRVPADLGCWPGHFPTRPILPAVLQLDWAVQLSERWLGDEAWPRRFEGLKFKHFVVPGQTLSLVLERDAAAAGFRFRIAQGETTFSLGHGVTLPGVAISPGRTTLPPVAEFPAVAEILPHAGAMILLRRVTSHAGDTTVCAAEIDDEALFRGPTGDVPAWIGLEYMAQCIAAHSGLIGFATGAPPRVGFLVGSRRMSLHVPAFRRGQRLAVQSRRIRGSGQGMAAFDCAIADADSGVLLVEALLSCFLPGIAAAAEQG